MRLFKTHDFSICLNCLVASLSNLSHSCSPDRCIYTAVWSIIKCKMREMKPELEKMNCQRPVNWTTAPSIPHESMFGLMFSWVKNKVQQLGFDPTGWCKYLSGALFGLARSEQSLLRRCWTTSGWSCDFLCDSSVNCEWLTGQTAETTDQSPRAFCVDIRAAH